MKRTHLLFVSLLAANLVNAQSQVIKKGILLPTKKGGNTLLPIASKSIVPMQPPTTTIILVGGKMNPYKEGNLLLPEAPATDNKNRTYVNNPNFTDLTSTVGTITTDSKKYNSSKSETKKSNELSENELGSLIGSSNSSNSSSLLDNSYKSNASLSNAADNKMGSLLEPLTNTKAEIKTQPVKAQETVDPALMSLNQTKNSTATKPIVTGVPNNAMPPLASIDSKNTVVGSKLKMPELAPIEGATIKTDITNKNGMPELAPIEGIANKSENKSLMPELAPIEDENALKQTQQSTEQPKVKTNLRGFTMPRGTTLSSRNGLSFIFKPAVPVEDGDTKKDNTEETTSYKPSAGGGMGMPALAPIIDEPKKSVEMPELAPIEETKKVVAETMPALSPIQNYTQQQQQYQQQVQPQQRVQYGAAPKSTYQSLQQAAKNHQHDANNPCCKVQMYKPNATKKNVAKKTTYKRRRTYYQPQVVYVYEDPHQAQPQQRIERERVVYVPTQKQYAAPQQQQTQQQQVQQPQQKVVYRDYTNVYAKQSQQSGNNQAQANKDGKKYYNPNNYATGLNAGPTAGDYTASNSANNVDMHYAFYLTPRGKYSVGLYNDFCSLLVTQNGELKEYKINADPKADPNSYKPRLNYFGKPENVAGVPIEYNYNRTVHKIGNIKFEYDFEGFFKTVGNSNVFYTSRSSLAKVDDIRVHYDGNANVSSVDANNGLIQFNPQ